MFITEKGVVPDALANEIQLKNESAWDNFWKIPRDKRTAADWEKLFDIQIIVKL